MKVLIVSGFLGAGKTSFIKTMSKVTKEKFVIVENEFAELDIDGNMLIQENHETNSEDTEMKVWQLSEGCICCSLNLDFAHSVLTIANTLNPDYLVVEPSGIAQPSRIIKKLKRIAYDRIELLAPITIIDAVNYSTSKQDFPDYFNDQIKTAGTVLVSKSENFSCDEFLNVKQNLNLGENIDFYETHYSQWNKSDFEKLLHKKMIVKSDSDNQMILEFKSEDIVPEQKLENVSITDINLKNPVQLMYVLMLLISGKFGRIVRAKGYFKMGDFWYQFDLVEGQYIISGYDEMPDNRVVVIGKNIDKQNLVNIFNQGI